MSVIFDELFYIVMTNMLSKRMRAPQHMCLPNAAGAEPDTIQLIENKNYQDGNTDGL